MGQMKGIAEMQAATQRLIARVQASVPDALLAGAEVVAERIRQNVSVRSGELRDSVRVEVGQGADGRPLVTVQAGGPGVPQALWDEFGTAAHRIAAQPGHALRLGATGRFAAAVQHPGEPPRPYFRPAVDATDEAAAQATAAQLRRATES